MIILQVKKLPNPRFLKMLAGVLLINVCMDTMVVFSHMGRLEVEKHLRFKDQNSQKRQEVCCHDALNTYLLKLLKLNKSTSFRYLAICNNKAQVVQNLEETRYTTKQCLKMNV